MSMMHRDTPFMKTEVVKAPLLNEGKDPVPIPTPTEQGNSFQFYIPTEEEEEELEPYTMVYMRLQREWLLKVADAIASLQASEAAGDSVDKIAEELTTDWADATISLQKFCAFADENHRWLSAGRMEEPVCFGCKSRPPRTQGADLCVKCVTELLERGEIYR